MTITTHPRFLSRQAGRQQTPESKRYQQDLKLRAEYIKGTQRAYKQLLDTLEPYAEQARALAPGKSQDDLKKRSREFVKLVKDLPVVRVFQDEWLGGVETTRAQAVLQARNYLLFPSKFPMKKALEAIARVADKNFEATAMAESQAPIRDLLPEDLRSFLPKNIVVEIDPDGTIHKITDRFANEHETLAVKIQTMHDLVRQYNDIVQQVKKDLKSGDERTRMAALVTAIIMETGIRPGQPGNKIKVKDGDTETEVETFGAVTLGPSHVHFVRDNFARLEFMGKKGTTNLAVLTDAQVIQMLNQYVEQARQGGSKFIFVTKDGETLDYTGLKRYFSRNFQDFSPTDFRKLKATGTVLANLRERQRTLYEKIRGFVDQQVENIKEMVTQEVTETVRWAYEQAQQALSHEDVDTTVGSYVNPEVVLRFLSQGRIEDTLEQALLLGKPRLSFDPQVFVQHALRMAGQRRQGATLGDILQELEKVLEV
jgi:predicted glycoside hydrolase/deacetylase ChbG (UPF0249 family)